MKKNLFGKQKEYSTETLIDVDYKPEDVQDYDNGKAPVTRNTQHAEELEDLVEFQKHAQGRDDLMNTHNYNVLNAVRNYDPDAGRRPVEPPDDFEEDFDAEFEGPEILGDLDSSDYDGYEDASNIRTNFDIDDEVGNEESFTTGDLGPVDAFLASAGLDELDVDPDDDDYDDDSYQETYSDTYDPQVDEVDEIADEYEPRPFQPGDVGYDDIMEQFTSAPTKPKYWFEEFGDYWSCSCGHINKGDYCTNCGLTRDLLRTLFILHKPGEEPGEYEGMPIKYEEVIVPKGRLSSRQKLIIAIAIIAILLIVGGLFTYFYMVLPNMEKEAQATVKTTTEALKTNVADCVDETDGFLWNSYISAGDACAADKKFVSAISYYVMAQQISNPSDLKDKITEAKYQYVLLNKDEGGSKFEKYLGDLAAMDYKDIKKIYNEYYAWHFKIVANLSPEDYSSDISTASRADIIYFHVIASGGPPGGSISVYYEATWPSGGKQTDTIGSNWTDGSKGSARFAYPIPRLLKEGTLKFNIYDRNSNELLGSDSIKLRK